MLVLMLNTLHKDLRRDSQWLREPLCNASTDLVIFSPHSIRSASTLAAAQRKFSLPKLISAAIWNNESRFSKYYIKSVSTFFTDLCYILFFHVNHDYKLSLGIAWECHHTKLSSNINYHVDSLDLLILLQSLWESEEMPACLCKSPFLAATKQLYEWNFLSVRLSHLYEYVPIIISSWNFQKISPWTRVRSMQKVKVKGQGHRGHDPT